MAAILLHTKEERIYLQNLLAFSAWFGLNMHSVQLAPNPEIFYSVDSLTVDSSFLPISLSYPPLGLMNIYFGRYTDIIFLVLILR